MSLLDLFSRKKSCDLLVNTNGKVVEKYRFFKDFLTHNREALNIIAALEQTYYGGSSFSMGSVKNRYDDLMASTRKLIDALNGISNGKYAALTDVCNRINRECAIVFNAGHAASPGEMVLAFDSLRPEMVKIAGSKATNLAIVKNALGVAVPPGFVITVHAFERFLEESGLVKIIQEMLADITIDMTPKMAEKCRVIQNSVLQARIPESLSIEILRHYASLEAKTRKNVRIAMRSSAVGEDTDASFAGQYITELNVTRENMLIAYKSVVAGKYSPRAILYGLRHGLEDRDTPMCVAGIAMVDSRASGVMYTVDPSAPESPVLKISAIWGLGEHLVSGEASADVFFVDKSTGRISKRDIRRKEHQLVNLDTGGVRLTKTPEADQALPSIDDSTVKALVRSGLALEKFFKRPQDVEWALDGENNIYILQTRPLGLGTARAAAINAPQVFPDHPILISEGKSASTGTAAGRVFIAGAGIPGQIPDDAILVTKVASPEYAALMGKIRGIITDVGSVASHLASVAREFGVPAIFDTGRATAILKNGDAITMTADTISVYQGIVPELTENAKPMNSFIFESPAHRRLKAVLDNISPLNLTDPKHPSFSPEGCRTLHDIIRFAHENAMKAMFGLSGQDKKDVTPVRLTANFPLSLYCIDLGGGIKQGLTTCDTITPVDIESVPMKAIWSGFAHPGISWSGTVNFGFKNFMTLMASSATAELGADVPGGDSYAIFSREYLNLSAKFGYHYANVDTFCGDDAGQNYIALQFSGGAGAYYGRTLRILFLSEVLGRLGFSVVTSGDLLDASLTGCGRASMEKTLDQLGRLLAASRLLDMAIPNHAGIDTMTEDFFNGNYDFLGNAQSSDIPDFYTHAGNWKTVVEAGRTVFLQDGSRWGNSLSSGMAKVMGKMVGAKYQEFLDNIRAYYYFPIAIARESAVSDAILEVEVRPVSGSIDQAGGLVFGLMNVGNYFVLRINALEDNFNLFEFINDRRFQRATVRRKIDAVRWYRIRAAISGHTLKGYLDDELLIEYSAQRPISGYVGIWTKADSVTSFDALTIEAGGNTRRYNAEPAK